MPISSCHELCHVWQMQHRPVRMPLSYALTYETNPYELQARRAAAATRARRYRFLTSSEIGLITSVGCESTVARIHE